MNKDQFILVRNMLGLNNLALGKKLGFTCTKYQCKQVDNLASGVSEIKPVIALALECLARRESKLAEFKKITETE